MARSRHHEQGVIDMAHNKVYITSSIIYNKDHSISSNHAVLSQWKYEPISTKETDGLPTPNICGSYFFKLIGPWEIWIKIKIFKLTFMIDDWGLSYEIVLRWISLDLPTLVQVMAWCHQAPCHCLSQCWPRYMLPYGTARLQWVTSLWPSDTILGHRSGSTLVEVMACCLMASSHYLNRCWLIIQKVQWQSSQGSFTRDTSNINC